MCRYRLESTLIPLLTVPACVLMVIAMSTKSWVIGHLRVSNQLVARISPWYLCANHCVTSGQSPMCTGSKVPALLGMDCFWMRDWSASGFSKYPRVSVSMETICLTNASSATCPKIVNLKTVIGLRKASTLWVFYCSHLNVNISCSSGYRSYFSITSCTEYSTSVN